MAGDWIKMRVSLKKDPCVISMADFLAHQRAFMDYITDPVQQSCKESVYEHITSDITRDITVASLLDVWGVARDRGDRDGDDLLLKHCTVESLDDMCGVPGFGEAMEYVEWAIEETTTDSKGRNIYWIRFPKFFKEHEAPEEKYKKQHAQAQAKYRAKKQLEKAAEASSKSDVTSDVTVTPREEERREEVNTPPPPQRAQVDGPSIEVFPMSAEWSPSEQFQTLAKLSGLPVLDEAAMAAGIGEFKAYWLTQPQTMRTQVEWDNSLVKSLKHEQVKSTSLQRPVTRRSAHAGFDNKDYSKGVNADGSLA